MPLLVQVVGALAAGLLVWVLARSVGLRGWPAVAAVAIVPIVAGALLSAPGLRTAITGFTEQRHANELLSAEQKRVLAGSFIEPNEDFLTWASERIAPGEEFQLVTAPTIQGEQQIMWVSYRLEPRVEVMHASRGGWIVFYGVSPKSYSGPEFAEVQEYEPGFAIGRYEGGG